MARGKRADETSFKFDGADKSEPIAEPVSSVVDPGKIDADLDAASSGSSGEDGNSGAGEVQYNKDGSIRQKRGRKPGSKFPRKENKAVPLDVNAIQFSLSGMHALMAIALFPKDEETQKALQLSENESKVLSENLAAVARHYDMVASQKSIDWFNLIMALATIEGPRIVLVARRKQITRPKPTQVATAHFSGTRAPVTPTVVPVKANGKVETHKPTEEETARLLNEAPIHTNMQSG